MADLAKALATQLANIEKRSGKSIAELSALIRASGLTKHGEIRDMLKRDLGLGHGDANTLTHHVLKADGSDTTAEASPEPPSPGIIRARKRLCAPFTTS